MLTIKIPKTVLNHQMFAYINQVIQLGIESIELDVQTFGQDDLVLCSHSKEAQVSSEEDFIPRSEMDWLKNPAIEDLLFKVPFIYKRLYSIF